MADPSAAALAALLGDGDGSLARLLAAAAAASAAAPGGSKAGAARVRAALTALEIPFSERGNAFWSRTRDGSSLVIEPRAPAGATFRLYYTFKVPEERRAAFALMLCGHNFAFRTGKIEMDMSDGELRFTAGVSATFSAARQPRSRA